MSVWVHKKENDEIISELIDPLHLQNAIAAGWTYDKSSLESSDEEKPELILDQDGKPDLDFLREQAKLKGIEGYDKMRTNSLIRALGYDN